VRVVYGWNIQTVPTAVNGFLQISSIYSTPLAPPVLSVWAVTVGAARVVGQML
jgi:hypothetical protein